MDLDISSLPKKRQRVIKYIIDNPDDVAISTSSDLAKKLDVNAATIVRASKDMGYSGYNELRKDKQKSFKQKQSPYDIVLKSLEEKIDDSDIIKKSLLKDIEVLNETVAKIKVKAIEKVTSIGISFGQGMRLTVDALKNVQAKGVTTVAITDSEVSPLLEFADHKLVTGVCGEFVYSSSVSAFSIANAIIHQFIKMGGEKSAAHLRELQQQMDDLNVWY